MNQNLPSIRLISAINLASHLHRDHHRKDEIRTPYISHLYSVASFLSSITSDEDVIIAGLMHDALEDVAEYEYEDLAKDCGVRVADIVRGVTENKSLPYIERKVLYLKSLENGSLESLMVSLADKIHNAISLKDVHDSHGMDIHTQIDFYKRVLEIGIRRLGSDHSLVMRLSEVIV